MWVGLDKINILNQTKCLVLEGFFNIFIFFPFMKSNFFLILIFLNDFAGVDIRSSKVCELGVLNYKAKRVFYPFEASKFRCRYDYYWASIFKVFIHFPLYYKLLSGGLVSGSERCG